jgi:hypothetical protein
LPDQGLVVQAFPLAPAVCAVLPTAHPGGQAARLPRQPRVIGESMVVALPDQSDGGARRGPDLTSSLLFVLLLMALERTALTGPLLSAIDRREAGRGVLSRAYQGGT